MIRNLLLVSTFTALLSSPACASSFWTIWCGEGKPQLADLIAKGFEVKTVFASHGALYALIQNKKEAYRCRIEDENNQHDTLFCDKIVPQHKLSY